MSFFSVVEGDEEVESSTSRVGELSGSCGSSPFFSFSSPEAY